MLLKLTVILLFSSDFSFFTSPYPLLGKERDFDSIKVRNFQLLNKCICSVVDGSCFRSFSYLPVRRPFGDGEVFFLIGGLRQQQKRQPVPFQIQIALII